MCILLTAVALAVVVAGCGQKPLPANRGVMGKDVVVILSTGKRFKQEVIMRVTASLEGKGVRVVRDATAAADAYRAADYGAVVYFAELWA